jgi:hypothetical protein
MGVLPTRPREVFCGFWWKTNADFQGISNLGNKMIFIKAQQNSGDNSFLGWMGAQNAPRTLCWNQQGQVYNCHVSGFESAGCWPVDGTGKFNPNINSAAATMAAGTGWYKVEIYLKSSTTFTSRDGVIKIWVNNTLSTSHSNVNLSPNGFEEWHINHTWDGSAIFAAPYRDTSLAWHHYWDQFYVSIPSTTGGGSTPVLQTLLPVTVSLAPGNTQTMTVGLSANASSNVSVSLSSSATSVATVPSSAVVNSGQSTASFTCTAVAAGSSTITASLSGATATSDVTVTSSGGGGGTPSNSTYVYNTQYSSTQGSNQWSYRDTAGNLLSYTVADGIWEIESLHPYLAIWSNGFHPGLTAGAVLRWTAPSTGSARITGSVSDYDTSAGDGVVFSIVYGSSSTLFSKDLSGSDAASYAYDVTQSMSTGDFVDFIVTAKSANSYDSTQLTPTIVFTPAGGTTNPNAPTVSSYSPTSGLRGSSVTLVGTNYNTTLTNNTVTFNGVQATVTSASATQLVCTVPSSATTGSLVISTSAGSATAGTYTVTDPVTPVVPTPTNFGGSAMLLLVLP